MFKGVVKLIYLYKQHKVELTGHTVVGKPEQQLEAVSRERAAIPWIHQVVQSAQLPPHHGTGGADKVKQTHP